MKRISSQVSKACQIPERVKRSVCERDDGRCIVCGRPGAPNAHYIPRSASGLGIEENIVTLCWECHDAFDHGDADDMDRIGGIIRSYLRDHYPGWDEADLYYKKYGE